MSKTAQPQIILLLADGFDEAGTGIILTRLRQMGLGVNLVGLRSHRVRGAHGLIIVPTTSLDRVLESAPPILALIIPGGASHLEHLRVDPRVSALIQQYVVGNATLVGLDDQAAKMILDLVQITGEIPHVVEPETGVYMEDFAYNLAQQLMV